MNPLRNITACIVGNIIEWYEFSLFAYLAPTFAKLFFPGERYIEGLLFTFLIFASGFIIRPLSAILLGHFGDISGRAITLKITIFMISLSSIITGLLPTYEKVGIFATLLLILCRLIQGFCIGGEFAGAMVYLTESAPAQKRAFLSSMTNNGSNIGVLLAIGACTLTSWLLTPQQFDQFGWRLLFILGGMLGLIGLWLRRDMAESETFKAIQKKLTVKYAPFSYVIKNYSNKLLAIIFLLFISACGSYVLMGYISTYLHVFLQVPLTTAYSIQTIFIFCSLLFVPVFAMINDRYSRKGVLLFSLLGYLIFTVPLFYELNFHINVWILLPLAIFYSAEQASTPVVMCEMLPAEGRYTGVSLAYNFTMALVGGTAAFINTALIEYFHNHLIIAFYVVVCALISTFAVVFGLPKNIGPQCDLTRGYQPEH